jgi:hypothetical protein
MSHKHYCGVEGHEWQCSDSKCECMCGELMESAADHSECFVELRDCPEHQDVQPPESSDDESPSGLWLNLPRDAEKPHCECGCADAHPEDVVGYCVWCSHVYVAFNAKTEAQHFSEFCVGAPPELHKAAK